MEQNQPREKSKIALLIAVSLMWFGVSFLLPFFGVDLEYKQVLLDEKIMNRTVAGNDIADIFLSVYNYASAGVFDAKSWRIFSLKMLGGSSPVMQNAYVVVFDHVNLLLYRLSILLSLFMILFPLVLASIVDAYYFREKGKWTYFLPSPTRHRYGQVFAKWSLFTSIFVFLTLPFVVIPFALVLLGIGLSIIGIWMWIAHTQKRI